MIQMYISTVIVPYFNILYIPWCMIIADDGDLIAETCRRDRIVLLCI
jgi:hypothetical protein